MKFFPITVVDDIFEHVEDVLDIAKNISYQPKGYNNFPGQISGDIKDRYPDLSDWIVRRIISLFWDIKNVDLREHISVDFQKIEPFEDRDDILNKGLIHYDEAIAAAVVYLNKTPEKDTGTSLYKIKRENAFYGIGSEEYQRYRDACIRYHGGWEIEDLDKMIENHRSNFNETARVQPLQNRMIFYSGDIWHTQTFYGVEPRYTLRVFISSLEVTYRDEIISDPSRKIPYPILRPF